MRVEGIENAVGMMTGRRLHAYVEECTQSGKYCCRVILTAGLSNALRVGDPVSPAPAAGTINILCWLSTPLDSHASMEALALVAEARTAAMLESGALSIVSGTPATGTGTDCIVVASPAERRRLRYVGKHLIFGQLIGASVYNAMRRAVAEWHSEYSRAASEVQEFSFATPPGR
jgi:adenosylcobinamide amidohydrolase